MAVKMVVWDLDDTFWKGTLSEGGVTPIEKNLQLVKKLTERGIMNSIVSKNDFESAMRVLREWNVAQYFIFPHISWDPKGENVRELLRECGLRAKDVIFLDDNLSNLEEVRYYNPDIRCEMPTYLDRDILSMEEFRGKADPDCSRLKQYRILEERTKRKKLFSTNTEFLRSSHIEITLHTDCMAQIDRIEELIQRTNQLNYTKNRMEREELRELLADKNVDAAYISVKDDFGEYGIVGFYLMLENRLVHFLFSCRILGFGVENYIYAKLHFPEIHVTGEVAALLDANAKIDWIREADGGVVRLETDSVSEKKASLLFIGGCDLCQASRYLELNFDVRQEFSTVVDGYGIRTSDTSQLIAAKTMDPKIRKDLCRNLPFMEESVTYATELYSGKYDVVVISLVDDYIRGVYRRKDGTYYITYGNYWDPEGEIADFPEEARKYLREHFSYEGRESASEFKKNVEWIISNIGDCKVILINGIDLDVSDWIGEDRCCRNREMNAVLDEIVAEHPDVSLVDMRKIVTDRSHLPQHDNRHFDRRCYYMMAQEILKICESCLPESNIKLKSMVRVEAQDFGNRVRNKLKKLIGGGYHSIR